MKRPVWHFFVFPQGAPTARDMKSMRSGPAMPNRRSRARAAEEAPDEGRLHE
jgi:hypothetical protein